MPTLRLIAVSTLSGMLIAGGWWAFINGAIHSADAFPVMHLIPALGATFAVLFFNFVSANQLNSEYNTGIKMWLFLWFTVACVSIGGAIWITAAEYPPEDNWPGVSIIICTLLVFFAGILFFIGRKNIHGGNAYGSL